MRRCFARFALLSLGATAAACASAPASPLPASIASGQAVEAVEAVDASTPVAASIPDSAAAVVVADAAPPSRPPPTGSFVRVVESHGAPRPSASPPPREPGGDVWGLGLDHVGDDGDGGHGQGEGICLCGEPGSAGPPDIERVHMVQKTSFVVAPNEYPPEIIQRVVRQQFRSVRRCYAKKFAAANDLDVAIDFEFVITPAGDVRPLTNRGSNPSAGRELACATNVLQHLAFPQPDKGELHVGASFELVSE